MSSFWQFFDIQMAIFRRVSLQLSRRLPYNWPLWRHVSPGLSDYTDSSGSQRRSSASSLPPSTGQSGQSTPRQQAELKAQLSQLKTDLQGIRRQQQLNTEEMREEIMNTFARIKVSSSVIYNQPQLLDFAPKWGRLVSNGTNPGLFQIKFQYILGQIWHHIVNCFISMISSCYFCYQFQ